MAGFRPGLGLGGRTHVLFVEIVGTLPVSGIAALTVELAAGVKTGGDDVSFEKVMGRADAI